MATIMSNEIKEKVWNKLIRMEGLREGSRAASDFKEKELKDNDTVDNAIEAAIVITAQAIFSDLWERQRIQPTEETMAGMITSADVLRIEDKWLHDACNFCHRRLPSVIRRKDGKRICARCEASQPYTEEEIHGETE